MKYIPRPIALWPLSKNTIAEDNEMFINTFNNEQASSKYVSAINNLGLQSLHTPVFLQGSPYFSNEPIELQSRAVLGLSDAAVNWRGISILFWIRLDSHVPGNKRMIMVGHIS